jgi:hypothetical protein
MITFGKDSNGKNFINYYDRFKVDMDKMTILATIRSQENVVFNNVENLWYNGKKSIIDMLFDFKDYDKINFINCDVNDYRFENILVIYKKCDFPIPKNVLILENGEPKYINTGVHAGKYRNMYWKVKENENIYYIMHIKDDIYTKYSVDDNDKVLGVKNKRTAWYLNKNGYISSSILINGHKSYIYLHQYIMNTHDENNRDMIKTIDHINQDKFDNRRENLRFATMSEQNKNKGRTARPTNACELPESLKNFVFPKFICYNNRRVSSHSEKRREFFTIEKHPKLHLVKDVENHPNIKWESTKSDKVPLMKKLEQTLFVLEYLNGTVSKKKYDETIKELSRIKLPVGIRLVIEREKYHFVFDRKIVNQKRYNYRMVLEHNDLQLMLNKFIKEINEKYYIDDKMIEKQNMNDSNLNEKQLEEKKEKQKHAKGFIKINDFELEEPIMLDFSDVKNNINDELYNISGDESLSDNINNDEISDEISIKNDASIIQDNNNQDNNNQNNQDNNNQNNQDNNNQDNNNQDNINDKKLKILKLFENNEIIKPDLPENFSLYVSAGIIYLQFSKKDGQKYCIKRSMKTLCIQTELNNLIKEINEKYPFLNILYYQVENPRDFVDNTLLVAETNKPKLQIHFTICNISDIDYIQYLKKETVNGDKKIYSYRRKISSYDLQSEFNQCMDFVNKKYNLGLTHYEIPPHNWKTTNKIK